MPKDMRVAQLPSELQERSGSAEPREIVVALAGNPNSGKTTVFNNLTGGRQHVGNYPGVTVERKEGTCRHGEVRMRVIDLPGTYSLTAYSSEEVVARDFIIDEKPDVVVDIIDSTNLERSLYLSVQLMELGVPLVLAFNMSDAARALGHVFDIGVLSGLLGAPIVQTVGHRNLGMDELLDAVVATAQTGHSRMSAVIDYGSEIEEELGQIQDLVVRAGLLEGRYDPRWLAVKALENDTEVLGRIDSPALDGQLEKSVSRLQAILGEHPETAMAGRRYGYISGACQEAVRSTIEFRHTMSDRIDDVVTHRVLGLPIFMGFMYLVFHLTFTLGDAPMGWIEQGFGWLGNVIGGWWLPGSDSALKSLLVDGIIGGVGGVIVFLPNILLLFLAIAVLEDSGYMARAAFIMDRVMHKIGLHGKSFIPMVIGFGCSVPAIMATRSLENRRDRLTTMLVIPLMSCGARLPIYALIIPAFFPEQWHGPMLWIIYVIGISLAVLIARLLRGTLLKGESVPLVMELPPYRMPTLKGVLIHMWERGWLYLRKAGTIILGISIVLWAMTSYPKPDEPTRSGPAQQADELSYSVAGRIGHAMAPVLKPMGFDWRIGTALIGAFAAKEVFVAQMGIVYAVGEADEESPELRDQLRANYSPLVAFCIMLFCLIGAPCMATIAITRRESNSWGWALFQWGGLTVVAYVLTVAVYQVGTVLSIGVV